MGPRGVVGVSCIFPESETSYLLLMKDTRNEVGINNGVISNTGVDLANVVNSNDGVEWSGGSSLFILAIVKKAVLSRLRIDSK